MREESITKRDTTMKELTVFENEQFGSVRVIEREGEPWFVAADVCRALEIQNTADALSRLDEDEKGVASTYTPGGDQALLIVSEPGLYTLVLGSRKPEAKAFKRWITHEVIPSIRKHGVYATDAVIDQIINNPDYGIRLLEALREEREKNALLQPKADYFDTLVERRTLTGIRETANELGIGQKKFVRFLLDRGYVYRDRKKRLQPYAVHVDDELFVLKEWQNDKASGTQLLITPKGRETFRLLLKNPAA